MITMVMVCGGDEEWQSEDGESDDDREFHGGWEARSEGNVSGIYRRTRVTSFNGVVTSYEYRSFSAFSYFSLCGRSDSNGGEAASPRRPSMDIRERKQNKTERKAEKANMTTVERKSLEHRKVCKECKHVLSLHVYALILDEG